MKKHFFFFTLLALFITACSIFKGGKEVIGISFEYDTNSPINYGYNLPIKIIATYSNGKKKNITSKDDVKVIITGATYSKERIYMNTQPRSFQKDTIFLKATYTKDGQFFSDSIILPFNYKGNINLYYNGFSGDNGSDGGDGGTSLIFRNGKNGDTGFDGTNGGPGHDLTVFIWKELSLFYVKVYDMVDDKNYYFKANNNTIAYNFNVLGGRGGQGGDGGSGGDGKDGKKTEKKTKTPGNGGDGGQGGVGGNGGKGGSIYFFIHPNAIDFKAKIKTNNNGGSTGVRGVGGKGGKAGSPLEGQSSKQNGNNGGDGVEGLYGQSGDVINIEVQQFDIEDVKNN